MNAEKNILGFGSVIMVVGLLIASIGTVILIRHDEALSFASLVTGIIFWGIGGFIHYIENRYQTTEGEKKR